MPNKIDTRNTGGWILCSARLHLNYQLIFPKKKLCLYLLFQHERKTDIERIIDYVCVLIDTFFIYMSKIRFATLNHEFHKIFMYYKLINIFNVSLTGNNPKDGISKGNGSKRGSKTSTSDKKIQFDSECNVNYYLRKNSDKKLSTGRDLEQGIPHRKICPCNLIEKRIVLVHLIFQRQIQYLYYLSVIK